MGDCREQIVSALLHGMIQTGVVAKDFLEFLGLFVSDLVFDESFVDLTFY